MPVGKKDKMFMKKLKTSKGIFELLRKLNFFHDAFIKSVKIESADSFSRLKGEMVKEVTGSMSLLLHIKHYNYAQKTALAVSDILLHFNNVKILKFQAGTLEYPSGFDIVSAKIEPIGSMLKMVFEGNSRGTAKKNCDLLEIVFSDLRLLN